MPQCGASQAEAGKDMTASLQSELANATSNAHSLQQAAEGLTGQLTTARAEVTQLSDEVATLQQQAKHDRQASEMTLKAELSQKERSWKTAMQQAVSAAVADGSARDNALRSCLRAELEAAAQQERETLKRASAAAMSQQEVDWQSQMASLRDAHAEVLAKQAAEFEARHAQQSQQAAAETQESLAANASKLHQLHAAAVAQQAQDEAQQLADCRQRCALCCTVSANGGMKRLAVGRVTRIQAMACVAWAASCGSFEHLNLVASHVYVHTTCMCIVDVCSVMAHTTSAALLLGPSRHKHAILTQDHICPFST